MACNNSSPLPSDNNMSEETENESSDDESLFHQWLWNDDDNKFDEELGKYASFRFEKDMERRIQNIIDIRDPITETTEVINNFSKELEELSRDIKKNILGDFIIGRYRKRFQREFEIFKTAMFFLHEKM